MVVDNIVIGSFMIRLALVLMVLNFIIGASDGAFPITHEWRWGVVGAIGVGGYLFYARGERLEREALRRQEKEDAAREAASVSARSRPNPPATS